MLLPADKVCAHLQGELNNNFPNNASPVIKLLNFLVKLSMFQPEYCNIYS